MFSTCVPMFSLEGLLRETYPDHHEVSKAQSFLLEVSKLEQKTSGYVGGFK